MPEAVRIEEINLQLSKLKTATKSKLEELAHSYDEIFKMEKSDRTTALNAAWFAAVSNGYYSDLLNKEITKASKYAPNHAIYAANIIYALLAYDKNSTNGFTILHYQLLTQPWEAVFGKIELL